MKKNYVRICNAIELLYLKRRESRKRPTRFTLSKIFELATDGEPGRWNAGTAGRTTNSHAACSKPSQPQWSETCRPPVVVACLVAVGERRLVCTSTTGDSQQHLGAEAEQRSLTYRHSHDERPGQQPREADRRGVASRTGRPRRRQCAAGPGCAR